MPDQPPASPRGIRVPLEPDLSSKGWRILVVLIAILAAFVIGSAIREISRFDEAGIGASIGMPAIIALFGMFWIADNWKDALTAAFAVTYFIFLAGILGIFVFPQQEFGLEGGAKVIVDNFTGLMAIVMGAYFGQEAVRAVAQAYSDAKIHGAAGAAGPQTGAGATRSATERKAMPSPVQIDTNARPR